MEIEELYASIDKMITNIKYSQDFIYEYFSGGGTASYNMIDSNGNIVERVVDTQEKFKADLNQYVVDSFTNTIDHTLSVDTDALDVQMNLGKSFSVRSLTDQGGSLIRSDSFISIFGGEVDNAVDVITNYYKLLYPDKDLNEITSEDNIICADSDIVMFPGLQNEDYRDGKKGRIVFTPEQIQFLEQELVVKSLDIGPEGDKRRVRIGLNEVKTYTEDGVTGNTISAGLNLFDSGTTLELVVEDKDTEIFGKELQLFQNPDRQPVISGFDILTATIIYMYVDSENGDDANEGTSQDRPKKTFDSAWTNLRYRHNCILYLKEGQEFEVDSSADTGYNTLIRMRRWGNTDDVDAPKLKFGGYRYTSDEDGNDYSGTRYLAIARGGKLDIAHIDLIPPEKTDDLDFLPWDYESSMIISNGGVSCYLDHCVCDITGLTGIQVIKQTRYSSVCTFSVYKSDITLGSEYFLYNRSNSPVVAYIDYGRFNNDDDLKDQMFKDVVRDADTGIPLNINSNFNVTK